MNALSSFACKDIPFWHRKNSSPLRRLALRPEFTPYQFWPLNRGVRLGWLTWTVDRCADRHGWLFNGYPRPRPISLRWEQNSCHVLAYLGWWWAGLRPTLQAAVYQDTNHFKIGLYRYPKSRSSNRVDKCFREFFSVYAWGRVCWWLKWYDYFV